MKPIFAHFLKIEFSVIFWRLTKNSRNFQAKIDQNCNFLAQKILKRKSQFASIFLYKKMYIVQNSRHVPIFCPST